MRTVVASLAVLMMAGSGALATAQPAGRRAGGPEPAALKQQLGLSDEQAAQLRKLWSDQRKEAIRRRADIAIARMELNEALQAPTIDEKVVAAERDSLANLQAQAVRARVDARLAVRKVLTPAQYEKMQQFRREHRRDGRGMMRGAWRRGPQQGPGVAGRQRGPRPGAAGGPPQDVSPNP